MSSEARIAIGVATLLGALGFVWIGYSLGKELPAGPTPFYGLAAFCAAVSLVCFLFRGGPVAARAEGEDDRFIALRGNWLDRKRVEFRSFDLSALNAVGWALVSSSLLLVVGMSLLAGFALQTEMGEFGSARRRGMTFAVGIPIFLSSIGWFQLGKWFLTRIGMPIYRMKVN